MSIYFYHQPPLYGWFVVYELVPLDGHLNGLQLFAMTDGVTVNNPVPTSFYIFPWSLLNAINGPSPAQPTGDSRTNLTVPAQQEQKTLQPSWSCAKSAYAHRAPGRRGWGGWCLERCLLEAQQSDLFLFLLG